MIKRNRRNGKIKLQSFGVVISIVIGTFFAASCNPQTDTTDQQPTIDPVKNKILQVSEKWDETVAKRFLTISELKSRNPKAGVYETEGYVANSVVGCNCPPEADCNCPVPHITISQQSPAERLRNSSGNELIIWVALDQVDRSRKYRFKVEVSGAGAVDRLGVRYVTHKISDRTVGIKNLLKWNF